MKATKNRTAPPKEGLRFWIPFALPNDPKRLADQEHVQRQLHRLVNRYAGTKLIPWSKRKGLPLIVPRAMAIKLGGLATPENDGELNCLNEIAMCASYLLGKNGDADSLLSLLNLRREIDRILSAAKSVSPNAMNEAEKMFRELEQQWTDRKCLDGAPAQRIFAVGLIDTILKNSTLFKRVATFMPDFSRWCERKLSMRVLLPPWYSDAVLLPTPLNAKAWPWWSAVVTRDFLLFLIPNLEKHSCWTETQQGWDVRRSGNRTTINLMVDAIRQCMADQSGARVKVSAKVRKLPTP